MSELQTLAELARELGAYAVLAFVLLRLEKKMDEVKAAIVDLKDSLS